jgi:ribonucleoside-diphosphate reductase beta chain
MYTIISKDACPWCTKAADLLTEKGIQFEVVKVQSKKGLQDLVPNATTVPQIFNDSKGLIGGYEDLVKYLLSKKKRTVFNLQNRGHETSEYPLFLGDALGFVDTINRPYPILDKLFQEQAAQIWNEFEVDITQDRQDMLNAPKPLVDCMVKTILWQHLADSIASRSITGILLENVSNSDLENWYNAVAFFESIHARTYSHIIKQTFVDPNDALKEGYENFSVIQRSDVLRKVFDDLGNLPHDAPKELRREKLYVALAALYMLEGVNFMSSFAITFGIAELGIFQGISQLVVLIARDELLHARGGMHILKIEFENNPEAYARIKPKIQEVFDAILEQEREWTNYLFSEGREILRLNKELVFEYVKFRAKPIADTLGLDSTGFPTKTPLPYMERYLDSSKVQVAAQEMQLSSYLLNSIDMSNTDYDKISKELQKL